MSKMKQRSLLACTLIWGKPELPHRTWQFVTPPHLTCFNWMSLMVEAGKQQPIVKVLDMSILACPSSCWLIKSIHPDTRYRGSPVRSVPTPHLKRELPIIVTNLSNNATHPPWSFLSKTLWQKSFQSATWGSLIDKNLVCSKENNHNGYCPKKWT